MNGSGRRPIPWVPLLLGVFAVLDLRVEVQLLLEHFTWSSLAQIPLHHPLAVAVLLLLPSLLRPTR
ncbi:MAG: hypothetical protein EB126_05535 [Synechococcaceae bacterium WBB_10_009]|nr:hypothetical protein [Synechococcaceae bacterium WBB_10_009]